MRNLIKTIRVSNRHMDKTFKIYEWNESLLKAFEESGYNSVGSIGFSHVLGDVVNDILILSKFDIFNGLAHEWFISKKDNEYVLHFVIGRDSGHWLSCRLAGECTGIIRTYRKMKRKIKVR
jgi:hypothetical protein